jgi:PAS domain S-box-containing protein
MISISPEINLALIFDTLETGVILYEPVFAPGNDFVPTDFVIVYCNKKVAEMTGVSYETMKQQRVLSLVNVHMDGRRTIFDQLCTVYKTGQQVVASFHNALLDRHYRQTRTKLGNAVLTEVKEITSELAERRERERQTAFTDQILGLSIDGWFTCEGIRSDDGTIVDFIITRINTAFTRMIGLSEEAVINKAYLSVFPAARQNGTFEMNCRVLLSGTAERKLIRYVGDGLDAWYDVVVSKLENNALLVNFEDISTIGRAPYGVIHYEPVYNDEGKIADFIHRAFNQVAIELAGLSFDEFNTMTAYQIADQRKNRTLVDTAVQVAKTGKPARFEYLVKKAGKWVDLSLVPYDDGVLMNFVDITPRIIQEKKVQEASDQFSRIVDASLNAIYVWKAIRDTDGVITDFQYTLVNSTYEKMNGRTKEEVIGKTALQLYPNLRGTDLFLRYSQVVDTGTSAQFEDHYRGEELDMWFEASAVKISEDEVFISYRDITEAKKFQLEQERMMHELKRSNEALEEFARAASHDLKEPIRKIQFFMGRLKDDLGGTVQKQHSDLFDRIEKASNRMRMLVEDLLEYSHISTNPREKESIDLNDKLRDVMDDLELLIREKKAVIEVGGLPTISGHRRQLQQLFQNVINNALKYSKPGVAPHIQIKAKTVAGKDSGFHLPIASYGEMFHLIEISDNGIGFDPEHAEKIFDVFTRLHGNSEYPGTGIGLSIVKKVAENHGGYVRASGEKNVGASFFILFPV